MSYSIETNIFNGFLIRITHLNFARFFFISIYIHLFRNIFYKRFNKFLVWSTGCILLLILILTAFIGYVLPWGQISFWGGSVITSFLTVLPYIGNSLLQELWRGFSIGQNLLTLFFSLHFILPLIILTTIIIHLIVLHSNLSSNKLFQTKSQIKKPFNRILLQQDFINFILLIIFIELFLIFPFLFDDPENSKIANDMLSPLHIKPEWYFLFAYAILRSIPNKLGGVIAIIFSVLFLLIFSSKKVKLLRSKNLITFFVFLIVCSLLTWIGGNPVEYPYITIGQCLFIIYFLFLIS